MAKAPSPKRETSPEATRRYIAMHAKLAAQQVIKELKGEVKEELKKFADAEVRSRTFPFDSDEYLDSPDRDILTPRGLRLLLGDLGEKAITKLVLIDDFPHLRLSNTYRFSRARVLEWLSGPGEKILRDMKASTRR